jgi:hypothetical protein
MFLRNFLRTKCLCPLKKKGNLNLFRVDIASFANSAGVRIASHPLTPIPPKGRRQVGGIFYEPPLFFASIITNFE